MGILLNILWLLLLLNYILALFVIIKLIRNMDKNSLELKNTGMTDKKITLIMNIAILFAFIPYFTLYKFLKQNLK